MADDGSNGSNMTPDASDRSGTPADQPPGLRAQIGATIAAGRRLLQAHIDLARAEMGEILDEVKRMVALAGLALGAFILTAILLFVGGLLFLGEWLFGSIGWGVLLGTLLLLDVAAIALLLALDMPSRRIGSAFVVALLAGLIVGVVLGLDLTHKGWTALGDNVAAAYDANTRAVLLAIGISATVLGVLGFLLRIRSGLGSAVGGLIAGAIIGVLVGGLTVISIPAQVGAAIGAVVGLVVWPIVAGRELLRTGVDGDAIMKKFTPDETIELTKETIEWVRARTPLVPKS